MYYIGIDVHKTTCVTTIKGRAKKILKQTSFGNNIQGMTGFIEMIRESKYVPATAVCESTGNYWWVLYDTLRETGINALVAHPYHTKIITEAAYKDDVSDSERSWPTWAGRTWSLSRSWPTSRSGICAS